MVKVQIILAATVALFTAFNYTVFWLTSKSDALPLAPLVLSLVVIPLLVWIFFGKQLEQSAPVLFEILKWIYIGVGLIYMISFIIFSIWVNSYRESGGKADVYIVLGCKTNGYSPSFALERRLDTAYDTLVSNPDSVAVLSGGKGDDETVSEAESMRAYLEKKGIDGSRLILEDRSESTTENIEFSMRILKEKGLDKKSVALITNDFHIRRALLTAKKAGYEFSAVVSPTDDLFRSWQNNIREYMVWVRRLLVGNWTTVKN